MNNGKPVNRNLVKRIGTGTVWLVEDPAVRDFLCTWYEESVEGIMLEQARVSSEVLAVDWGRSRTPQVVLQVRGATSWAGDGAPPASFPG